MSTTNLVRTGRNCPRLVYGLAEVQLCPETEQKVGVLLGEIGPAMTDSTRTPGVERVVIRQEVGLQPSRSSIRGPGVAR